MYNQFINFLESVLTVEKISSDLYDYLSLNASVGTWVKSGGEISGMENKFYVTREDSITIYNFRITKRYLNHLFYPYIVEVILGDFTNNENTGILILEKCKAELFYSSDFSLVSIDFTHADGHEVNIANPS